MQQDNNLIKVKKAMIEIQRFLDLQHIGYTNIGAVRELFEDFLNSTKIIINQDDLKPLVDIYYQIEGLAGVDLRNYDRVTSRMNATCIDCLRSILGNLKELFDINDKPKIDKPKIVNNLTLAECQRDNFRVYHHNLIDIYNNKPEDFEYATPNGKNVYDYILELIDSYDGIPENYHEPKDNRIAKSARNNIIELIDIHNDKPKNDGSEKDKPKNDGLEELLPLCIYCKRPNCQEEKPHMLCFCGAVLEIYVNALVYIVGEDDVAGVFDAVELHFHCGKDGCKIHDKIHTH